MHGQFWHKYRAYNYIIQDKVQEWLGYYKEEHILYFAVFLIIGILLKQAYIFELSTLRLTVVSITAFASILLYTKYKTLLWLSLVGICTGIICPDIEKATTNITQLNEAIKECRIFGDISAIKRGKVGHVLFLVNHDMTCLEFQDQPIGSIKLSTNSDISSFKIGDRVALTAELQPPFEAIIGNSFNFAEYLYFNGICATGHTISKIILVEHASNNDFKTRLNSLRYSIIQYFLRHMSEAQIAGIAIALTVGDTSYIPRQHLEYIRISGIAHVIAISGMHMVIVTGLLFSITRFILLRHEHIGLRLNVHKIAAFMAILCSFFYLCIADFPISAKRAFMMSGITMLAIIMGRVDIAMRSLIIAAIITLILSPHYIKSPSMQMSFAACLGLIGLGNAQIIALKTKATSFRHKILYYIYGIIKCSTFAHLTTLPFSLYNFYSISNYSIITNILIIPIVDYFIMLFIMLSVLFMPFEGILPNIPIKLAEYSISLMLYVAKYIAQLKHASFHFNGITPIAAAIIGLGIILICAYRTTAVRLLGVLVIMSSLLFMQPRNPIIAYLPEHDIIGIKIGDTLYLSSKRSGRYIAQVAASYMGARKLVHIKEAPSSICSDQSYCIIESGGVRIMVYLNESNSAQQVIETADIVVHTDKAKPPENVAALNISQYGHGKLNMVYVKDGVLNVM